MKKRPGYWHLPRIPAAALAYLIRRTAPVGQEACAYPNPFSITLSHYLTQAGPVSVKVYNNLGSKVRPLRMATEATGSPSCASMSATWPAAATSSA